MAINVKVGKIGILDIIKFSKMTDAREEYIQNSEAKEISSYFPINETAKALHPDFQHMIIDEIIEHKGAGAKTYIMKKADGTSAAYFRAGQYVSVLLSIDGSLVTRPYSISSSPKWALEGKVAITVRENKDGFAAAWILKNWKKGDDAVISGPEGTFYFESFRDSENVIALAGGSGITPFLSMAYAIRDGIEDFNLTIIFGSRDEKSILFKDELNKIAAECSKVKIVNVLSEEKKKGYENGFITAEIIKKYAPKNESYSVFMCGPEAMYRFAEGEIAKLGIEKKFVRRELLGVTKKVWEQKDYPAECKGKVFKATVKIGGKEYTFDANADETVLVAIERAGVPAPSRCRSGECGWCRSKLASGTVFVPEENEGRRWADKEYGYIHPCASFPTSDIVIELPGSYLK